jgi:septum site-determining protein MinC
VEELTGQETVEVKGWRNGLLLVLPLSTPWDEVIEQTHSRLDEAKARSFWRGAQTTLDCGTREVSSDELTSLMDRIKRGFGLVPVAIVAQDASTRIAGEKLALKAYEELPVIQKHRDREKERETEMAATNAGTEIATRGNFAAQNALYVPGTVRSGQQIVHDTHLVIVGDVNAGAEVSAGGDIIVFGSLRGLAHAGCFGDETARIVAGNLRPPQLRIAGKIARSPEESERSPNFQRLSEVARIEGGEIGVFPL